MKKICSKCSNDLDEIYFCHDKRSKDGFQSQCKICKRESVTKSVAKHRDRYDAYMRRYMSTEEYKERKRRWYHAHKLSMNVSRMMRRALGKSKNGCTWELLVSYSLYDLKSHLERQFVDGMTWENYGSEWHVDHIVPQVSFSITSPLSPDFQECWKLENLRPLWAKENLSKGSKGKISPSSTFG